MCIEPDPKILRFKKIFNLINCKKDLLEKAGKVNSEIEINLYKKTNITRFSKIKNKFKVENSSDKLNITRQKPLTLKTS